MATKGKLRKLQHSHVEQEKGMMIFTQVMWIGGWCGPHNSTLSISRQVGEELECGARVWGWLTLCADSLSDASPTRLHARAVIGPTAGEEQACGSPEFCGSWTLYWCGNHAIHVPHQARDWHSNYQGKCSHGLWWVALMCFPIRWKRRHSSWI